MNNKNIIETRSAVKINNYKNDILFHLKDKPGLWIGIKENYDNQGHYDNTNNTLCKITNNEKLYNLLYGSYSHIAFSGLITNGTYSLDDIVEFYKICRVLNIKIYEDIDDDESDNENLYKIISKNTKTEEE